MSTTNIKFRRGNKADLPQSAPSGTPLWCEDTKELYLGIDNGVTKVGGVSQEVDVTNVINPIGNNSDDTSKLKCNTAISMQGGKITAETFEGDLNGNATSSTNATNDASGNNIEDTYLKKIGGNITGDLSIDGTTTGNFTGNLSGNASSATNATNDGVGDNIVETYARKTDLESKLNKDDIKAYITEVYTNGNSGYVKYSNGYCEQWGVADIGEVVSNGSDYVMVVLLKSYNDQNYTIQATHKDASSSNKGKLLTGPPNITNQQFSYFYIKACTNSTNDSFRYFYWRTFGYLMTGHEGIIDDDLGDLLG